jgi:hypothetical protein
VSICSPHQENSVIETVADSVPNRNLRNAARGWVARTVTRLRFGHLTNAIYLMVEIYQRLLRRDECPIVREPCRRAAKLNIRLRGWGQGGLPQTDRPLLAISRNRTAVDFLVVINMKSSIMRKSNFLNSCQSVQPLGKGQKFTNVVRFSREGKHGAFKVPVKETAKSQGSKLHSMLRDESQIPAEQGRNHRTLRYPFLLTIELPSNLDQLVRGNASMFR